MNLVSPPAQWHCLEPRHPLWHMIATMLVLVLDWFLTRRFCAFFSQFLLVLKEIQDSVVVFVGRSFFAFSAIKFYLITICCGILFLENVQQSLWSIF